MRTRTIWFSVVAGGAFAALLAACGSTTTGGTGGTPPAPPSSCSKICDCSGCTMSERQECEANFEATRKLAQDKHLSMLVSSQDAGIIWAEPGLDLTAEAMKRFDAATSVSPKR